MTGRLNKHWPIVLATFCLMACGDGTEPSGRSLALRLPDGLGTGRAEAGGISSCTGFTDRLFEDAVSPLEVRDSEVAVVEPGAVAARWINTACEVVAVGCVEDSSTEEALSLEPQDPVSICTDDEFCMDGFCIPRRDAGTDALPEGVTRSPDGEGYCCPITIFDYCNCNRLTYFESDADNCRGDGDDWVCDATPTSWRPITDEHGCDGFEIVPPLPGDSCF